MALTSVSGFFDSVRNLRSTNCVALMAAFGTLVNLPCAKSIASYFHCLQASAPKELDDDDDDDDDNDDTNEFDDDAVDKLDCVDDAVGFETEDAGLFSSCIKYFPSGLHRLVIKSEPLDIMMSSVPTNFRTMMLSVCAGKLQLGTLGEV